MNKIMITSEQIRKRLKTKLLGSDIYAFKMVSSTNEFARELAQRGAGEGTLIIAEEQTAGKGRMKRTWHSCAGKGLWFSLILRPNIDAHEAVYFPYLMSVSIAQALEQTLSITASLKWPNDLLIRSKKFCGILSEIEFTSKEINYIIIGIGINVLQQQSEFPDELADQATSLAIELNQDVDRVGLLCNILQTIESNYLYALRYGFKETISDWKSRCPFIGKKIKVMVDGKLIEGLFKDLDDSGGLILKREDSSEIQIYAGDFITA